MTRGDDLRREVRERLRGAVAEEQAAERQQRVDRWLHRRFTEDMHELVQIPAFRRVVHLWLERFGQHEVGATDFMNGRRSVALELRRDLGAINPQLPAIMEQEYLSELPTADELEE